MVVLENVVKAYRTGSGQVKALDGVNLRIEEGQFVVISGPSGSGKTTLLMTMAGMLRPSGGKVSVGGSELYKMSIPDRASFRAGNIGFVFQMFHLVPYLNVIENVVLAGRSNDKPKANELLKQLGLSERAFHKPSQLSAGEKQRTAVARALLNQPKIILADEPTGNLDPDNSKAVLGFLAQFHLNGGTVIIVTHGNEVARFADRTVNLQNGRIENPD